MLLTTSAIKIGSSSKLTTIEIRKSQFTTKEGLQLRISWSKEETRISHQRLCLMRWWVNGQLSTSPRFYPSWVFHKLIILTLPSGMEKTQFKKNNWCDPSHDRYISFIYLSLLFINFIIHIWLSKTANNSSWTLISKSRNSRLINDDKRLNKASDKSIMIVCNCDFMVQWSLFIISSVSKHWNNQDWRWIERALGDSLVIEVGTVVIEVGRWLFWMERGNDYLSDAFRCANIDGDSRVISLAQLAGGRLDYKVPPKDMQARFIVSFTTIKRIIWLMFNWRHIYSGYHYKMQS